MGRVRPGIKGFWCKPSQAKGIDLCRRMKPASQPQPRVETWPVAWPPFFENSIDEHGAALSSAYGRMHRSGFDQPARSAALNPAFQRKTGCKPVKRFAAHALLFIKFTSRTISAFLGPMMVCVRAERPWAVRGLLVTKEDEMKLVTRFEAASHSTAELHGLLREAFNALAAAPRGSLERRNALASMRNIEAELATRGPGF